MRNCQRLLVRVRGLAWAIGAWSILAGSPVVAQEGAAEAQIDPGKIDIVQRLVLDRKQDLLRLQPDMDPQELEGMLFLEALRWLDIGREGQQNASEAELLKITGPVREVAQAIAARAVGRDVTEPDGEDASPPPLVPLNVPASLEKFEDILTRLVQDEDRALREEDDPDRAAKVKRFAVDQLVVLQNKANADELDPAEKTYIEELAERTASGEGGNPVSKEEEALDSDIRALFEILGRERLRLVEEEGISEPKQLEPRLRTLGTRRIGEAMRARDPSATVTPEIQARIDTVGRLVANRIGLEQLETVDPEEVGSLLPEAIRRAIVAILRQANQKLVAQGHAEATRRASLRASLLDGIGTVLRIVQLTTSDVEDTATLRSAITSSADALVDEALASGVDESPGTTATTTTTTTILVPSTTTTATAPGTMLLVPMARQPWCWPFRKGPF